MSEIRDLLQDTAARLLAAHPARGEGFAAPLWDGLEAAGLTSMTPGAEGPDLADIAGVIHMIGRHAAAVPLAETLIAQWLATLAGLGPLPGVLACGPILERDHLTLTRVARGWRLSGQLRAVPFGRHCSTLVALAHAAGQPQLLILPLAAATAIPGENAAGEPRDSWHFADHPVADDALYPAPQGVDRDWILQRGALLRSVAMAGAIARTLELSIRYAGERQQFGRPLAKFQVIQQMLAQLAGCAALATSAADGAVAAAMTGGGAIAIAAAKASIGAAATEAAALAHQVHGAMGFTREHELHRLTRRLWVWREDYGAEAYWQLRLGRTLAERGGHALWSTLAEPASLRLADSTYNGQ